MPATTSRQELRPRPLKEVSSLAPVWGIVALALLCASGCHHKKSPVAQPPAPQAAPPALEPYPPTPRTSQPARIPVTPVPPGGVSDEDRDFINLHRPIRTEVGLATWYTAPYKGKKAANGQVFEDGDLTAAHRTLPMGSLIVVTNEKTNQSATMRVTDRGPFIKGRLLDLSPASAKATGVYRAGMVNVRMDVYKTPKPIDTGGRWCVQIGAFEHKGKAMKLKKQLERKYPDAQVIDFAGDTGHWVRIRPEGDNRREAEKIARHLKPAEGDAFLTRLD